MIKLADGWKDYEIIASGDGKKLERWGKLILLRPDPQAIWHAKTPLERYGGINAEYIRSENGGGSWKIRGGIPDEFTVSRKGLIFHLKLMGFKHTGLFPEQAVNWEEMSRLIAGARREIKVLNLFGYTGGATLACAKAGAKVTHVDAARAMVERCKQNAFSSGIDSQNIRYIVDDCAKFIARETRRGSVYDAVVMDPPSYGRGAGGEVWKLEDNVHDLVKACARILSPKPLFFLINSYTTGLQPTVMENLLKLELRSRGVTESYEIGLPTKENIPLPCGCSAMWRNGETK